MQKLKCKNQYINLYVKNFSQWEEKTTSVKHNLYQNLVNKFETLDNKIQNVKDLPTSLAIVLVDDQLYSFRLDENLTVPSSKQSSVQWHNSTIVAMVFLTMTNHLQTFIATNLKKM